MAELDAFFQPASVAIFGASERPGSMGGLVLQNLLQAGFDPQQILAVNRKNYQKVFGVPCVTALKAEHSVDLAVLCLPGKGLQRAIKSVAASGCKAALILSGGMARDQLTVTRMRRLKLLARHWGIRLLGPNSLGLIVPSRRLNLSWSHVPVAAGDIAYVGMSSALGSALLDWAAGRGFGFSHFVTVGARADISASDVVDYLAGDRRVKAILLHVETIRNAERFMTVLRAASKTKKVLILNTDLDTRIPAGLDRRDHINQAFFDRAGVLQVDSFHSLLGTLQTLSRSRPLYSHSLALVSNGLGQAFLARQELQAQRGELADLSALPTTVKDLCLHSDRTGNEYLVLPPAVTAEQLRQVLQALDGQPGVGAVMVVLAPNVRLDVSGLTDALMAHHKATRRTLMVVWLGEATVRSARDQLDAANILNFDTTEAAMQAYAAIVRHERVQSFLRETPEKTARINPDPGQLSRLRPDPTERGCLGWQQTRDLLTLFGFRLNDARYFASREALAEAAPDFEFPVAVRLIHERYLYPFAYSQEARFRWHGVAIDVAHEQAVLAEADRLTQELVDYFPDSPALGFAVQPMRRRLDSLQFSLGITRDRVYGPVLLFGLGGSRANVRADRKLALPPLNRTLARLLLRDTRVYELLQERCRQPLVAEDALVDAIMRLSELVEDCPWVRGLEMNILLEHDSELVVLGAAAEQGGERPPVIPVYPGQWERGIERSGSRYLLRPVRAEDEPALKRLYESQPQEALRLRFFGSRLHFAHRELAAMCQIDYRREMALVLEDAQGRLTGEVRGWTRVDARSMEFAIMLDRSVQGLGLARELLGQLEAFAAASGIVRMTADILPDNVAMKHLADSMGYAIVHRDSDSIMMEKILNAV